MRHGTAPFTAAAPRQPERPRASRLGMKVHRSDNLLSYSARRCRSSYEARTRRDEQKRPPARNGPAERTSRRSPRFGRASPEDDWTVRPLSLEQGGQLPGQLDGQALLLAGMLEQEKGGHGLAVHLARREDGQDVKGQLLELGDAAFLRIEDREVERHQGGVVAHVTLQELPLHLLEGLLRRPPLAAPERHPPFGPAQADEVEIVAQAKRQLLHLGQQRRRHL